MNTTRTSVALAALFTFAPAGAMADTFNCVETGGCTEPALLSSTTCLEGRDFDVSLTDRQDDVSVIAIHGGAIEAKTSEIATALANRFGYNLYTFNGHGTSTCLAGMSNTARLHITSTNFDEATAMELVEGSAAVVSVHGYAASRGYNRGVICVGGSNAALRQAFIDHVNAEKGDFTLYTLEAVDAATSTDICADIAGTAPGNIANQGEDEDGGLQLELGYDMRMDLVTKGIQYNILRDVVYGAVEAAVSN